MTNDTDNHCDECTMPVDPWAADARRTRKPEHTVYQLDGWPNTPPGHDMIISGDEDHDAITGNPRTRYRSRAMGTSGVAVRVLILQGTDPATAARMLRKMADSVDRGGLHEDPDAF
jgi:hypothetical protein